MPDYEAIKRSIKQGQPIPKSAITTQENHKISDKYNTLVRQAISDEYVRCSKERKSIQDKIIDASQRLANGKDILSYSEYVELKSYVAELESQYSSLTVELNTWDKAREICLNIADEH